MDHLAIDLGGRESQICIRSADGTITCERRHATRELGQFLAERPPSVVILETCAEAFRIADLARAAGHDVRVVPATLVRSLGIGARNIKTDQVDARRMSEASCRMELPSVHIPSAHSRERKAICGMRDALVSARTMLINNVRGWLRGAAVRLRTGGAESFTERVRALDPKVPSFVERQLAAIDELCKQIADADKELAADAKQDEVCRRLMSVPGVGPITALRFVSALDDVSRFDSAHKVESYLGLTPGESSSSDRKHRLGITRAGAKSTRWVLIQAAWNFRRLRRAHPAAIWSMEVEKRRGKKAAIVALARKLAGILYALWRNGTTYDPDHRAEPRTTTAAA